MEDSAIIRLAFREVIMRWRAELRISQFKMAALCATSRTHISRLENCKESTTLPKINTILNGIGKSWTEFGEAMDKALKEQVAAKQIKLKAAENKPIWSVK